MKLLIALFLCVFLTNNSYADEAKDQSVRQFLMNYAQAYYLKDLPKIEKLVTKSFFDKYKKEGFAGSRKEIEILDVRLLKIIESENLINVNFNLTVKNKDAVTTLNQWFRLEITAEGYLLDEVLQDFTPDL